MPRITFDGVRKTYADTVAVERFDGGMEDGEFLVLLGPSGCGKSTMLRMVAGLIEPTDGRILFGDTDVTGMTPKERRVAFVFQSYALYPHLTVRQNIAFPLVMDRFRWWYHLPVVGWLAKRRVLRTPAVAGRVDEIAALMQLGEYLDRRPKTLSGGQRQRVALGRALVGSPEVYLLDEPLSNLDATLRHHMRSEILRLYRRVGKSFIYVTHDQVEAMTMGTQIVVMNEGSIQQAGTPEEIYARPANTFVARFIGSPPMNVLDVEVADDEIQVVGAGTIRSPGPEGLRGPAVLGFRPEETGLAQGTEGGGVPGTVLAVERHGGESVVEVCLSACDGHAGDRDGSCVVALARVPGLTTWEPGALCRLEVSIRHASWFDAATGVRIGTDDRQPA